MDVSRVLLARVNNCFLPLSRYFVEETSNMLFGNWNASFHQPQIIIFCNSSLEAHLAASNQVLKVYYYFPGSLIFIKDLLTSKFLSLWWEALKSSKYLVWKKWNTRMGIPLIQKYSLSINFILKNRVLKILK